MRKRKHRKQYALINPLLHAIEGAAVTDKESLDKLRHTELTAIESFRTGTATVDDWVKISEVCNLAESMACDGIGPEALEATSRAQQALIEAHQRFIKTGKMGTSGQGLNAFRDVYQYHDLQRQSIARSVYERHIRMVMNKVRSKAPDVLFLSAKGIK